MRRGVSSRAGRRGSLAGVVAVLMVTVAAGFLAIVHYASLASSGPASSTSPAGPGTHGPDTAALRKNTRPAASRYGSSSTSPRARRAAAAAFGPNAAATAAPAFFRTLPPAPKLPSGPRGRAGGGGGAQAGG